MRSRSSPLDGVSDQPQHSVSEASKRAGLSIDTLRYYERSGLLAPIERNGSGHRRYSDLDLGWLSLIRCLRDTGMGIAEIRRFIELTRGGETTVAERASMLARHDERIAEQIRELESNRSYLRAKLDSYSTRIASRQGAEAPRSESSSAGVNSRSAIGSRPSS